MSGYEEAHALRSDEEQKAEDEEEKRKARHAFSRLRKHLKQTCEGIERVGEWHDIAAGVEGVLARYEDVMPPAKLHRIRQILDMSADGLEGAGYACDLLQKELKGLVKVLTPATAPVLATALTAAAIVIVVGALLLAVTANVAAVDLRVDNLGCGDINLSASGGASLPESPLLGMLGIQLPDAIADGGTEMISFPPVRFDVDNLTEPAELRISALGVDLPIPIGSIAFLELDGEPLSGRQTAVRFRARGEHHLIIRCDA